MQPSSGSAKNSVSPKGETRIETSITSDELEDEAAGDESFRSLLAVQLDKYKLQSVLMQVYIQNMFNDWSAERPARYGIHASKLIETDGVFCLRQCVLLERHHLPQKDENSWITNARFLNGWSLHQKYQSLLERFANVVWYRGKPELDQTHYDAARKLAFSPDAIIEYAGVQYVVEIKGYNLEHFEKLESPPKTAVIQANLYCHLTGYPRMLILVECKNDQRIKVWTLDHMPELARPYVDRAVLYTGFLEQGETPERHCKCTSIGSKLALRCPARDLCWTR